RSGHDPRHRRCALAVWTEAEASRAGTAATPAVKPARTFAGTKKNDSDMNHERGEPWKSPPNPTPDPPRATASPSTSNPKGRSGRSAVSASNGFALKTSPSTRLTVNAG